ncbi:MAG: outer membrane lipoprotein-sorting protein, partial [Candidatus Omnitrophica bacterium]|nr:outer membrane lipoprotein-sorting protein [Candidatus Omnitrophota bacterium]
GKGEVIKPIPEGSIVLVSYRYLSGDSLKTSNAAKVVLEKVQDNYAQIQDLKADLTITSTLNGEVFGTQKYGRFIFRAPDNQKIENWTNQDRNKKSGATIVSGEKMYLVNALGSYQEVNYLEGTGTDSSNLNQMDIFYGLDKFIEGHDVLLEQGSEKGEDVKDATVLAAPKQDNGAWTYLSLNIDRQKGIMAKSLLYQGEMLVQTLEYEGIEKLGKAWVPTKMVNTLHLSSGEFVTTTTFENVQLNTGVQDIEFDPKTVSEEFR